MGTTYGGDIAPDEDDRAVFCEVWNRKRIGLAVAESVYGPWKRLDEPVLSPRDCRFWDCTAVTNPAAAILPDGKYCGEWGADFYAESTDCIHWEIPEEAKVYGRHVRWDDGTETDQPNLERPFLLFENGRPRCFYFATGEGNAAYQITHSYNIAVPVKQEN